MRCTYTLGKARGVCSNASPVALAGTSLYIDTHVVAKKDREKDKGRRKKGGGGLDLFNSTSQHTQLCLPP